MTKTFQKVSSFRLSDVIINKMDKLVESNPKYKDRSHLMRCAIIKLYISEIGQEVTKYDGKTIKG